MSLSKLKVVNAAIVLTGSRVITQAQLTAGTQKSAAAANALYDIARNEMLELPDNWEFCTTRTELIAKETDPAFGYAYQYDIPTNCLRPVAVVDEDDDEIEYKWRSELQIDADEEYDVILTNQASVFLKYIYLRSDESKWPAWFARLVIVNLAIYLCEPLKQKSAKQNQLERMWTEAYGNAKEANALAGANISDSNINIDKGNTDVLDAASIEEVTQQRIIQRGARLYVGTNYIFYGADSTTPATAAMIEGLSDNIDSNQKNREVSITAGAGEYVWYCYPVRLGTSTFYVGGTEGGFKSPESVSFTNSIGLTETYYCYRSTNANLGTIALEITD